MTFYYTRIIIFIFLTQKYFIFFIFCSDRIQNRLHIFWWLIVDAIRRDDSVCISVSVICHQSRSLIASSVTVTRRQSRRENGRKK